MRGVCVWEEAIMVALLAHLLAPLYHGCRFLMKVNHGTEGGKSRPHDLRICRPSTFWNEKNQLNFVEMNICLVTAPT